MLIFGSFFDSFLIFPPQKQVLCVHMMTRHRTLFILKEIFFSNAAIHRYNIPSFYIHYSAQFKIALSIFKSHFSDIYKSIPFHTPHSTNKPCQGKHVVPVHTTSGDQISCSDLFFPLFRSPIPTTKTPSSYTLTVKEEEEEKAFPVANPISHLPSPTYWSPSFPEPPPGRLSCLVATSPFRGNPPFGITDASRISYRVGKGGER